MAQIKLIFKTEDVSKSLERVEEIRAFTNDLESFEFHSTTYAFLDSEQAILYYIAGYIAKSLTIKWNVEC